MAEKRKQNFPVAKEQTAEAALDSLNEELRTGRNTRISPSRVMEATIEAKARKRRGREGPASSAWKPRSS